MSALKPAYLIHGDDHGAIAERRARLKALAEGDGDAGSVEILAGDDSTPEAVALPATEVPAGSEPVGHGPIRFIDRAMQLPPTATDEAEAEIFAVLSAS